MLKQIICVFLLSVVIKGQSVNLTNFKQVSHPIQNKNYEYGNVSYPGWSKNDDFIGVSFFDPLKNNDFVFVYNLKSEIGWKYDASMTGETKQKSDFEIPGSNRLQRTVMLQWSPIMNNRFFVISREKKQDFLFRVDFLFSNQQFATERVIKISDQNLPIQNYSISELIIDKFWGNKSYYISMCSGATGRTQASVYQANKDAITREIFGEKDTQVIETDLSCVGIGNIKEFITQGIQNDQSDIYYYDIDKFQSPIHIINLTKTPDFDERIPLSNPSHNSISYLRSNRHAINQNTGGELQYGLYIFDKTSRKEILVDNDVYVVPDVPNVNPYIWLSDNQILYIKNDYKNKYPLWLYTVSDGSHAEIPTPLVNPKELALSNDKQKLAIVGKGLKGEALELSFNKLFVCDIDF